LVDWIRKNGSWNKGKPQSQSAKTKYKEWRKTQVIPRKDTKPERILQIALSLEGIEYEKHKPITGQPDIFIEPNHCIFADGDYWHKTPRGIKRDKEVNLWLENNGYQTIRFWEYEIKSNVNSCIEKIKQVVCGSN